MRKPRLAAATIFLVLAVLASTMTYTGFLVVGVLSDHLGIGRLMAGLLLGGLFARFPRFSKGKLRTVGLLPKFSRRPAMVCLLALCLLSFLSREEYVPALFTSFSMAFLLTYPWIRRAIVDRILSSLFQSAAGPNPSKNTDGMVIDGEFREKKD